MSESENPKKPELNLQHIFDDGVAAIRRHDLYQARELLEIVISEDPTFSAGGRQASDVLADIEFQLAEKNSFRRKNRLLGGITGVLGLGVILLAILLIVTLNNASRLKRDSSSANATLSAQTGLLFSSQKTVTAANAVAESARATMTTMRQNPAAAQATIQAYESLMLGGITTREPVYGPFSGQLLHDESEFVISQGAGVNLKNAIVQARFYNPYGADENAFDYGFFFRDTGGDQQYRLVVNSDLKWILDFVDDPDWSLVENGSLSNFDRSQGGSNLLRLVILDDRTLFYVNDAFIHALPTQAKIVPGDIFIVTASYEGHEISGRFTRYEDFTIWPLP